MELSKGWSLVNSHWSLGQVCRVFCLVSCFLVLGSAESRAQTFAEWFEQGKTLIKYLGTQIAYLNLYESGLKQGYNEAKSDLGLIGNFKNGELGFHSDYYASLKQVSPEVKASADFASIQPEVTVIGQQFSGVRGLSGMTLEEQAYVNGVGAHVLALCDQHLDELGQVLSSGALSMTDAERIQKVREISASVKEAYVFACGFCGQVRVLAAQRLKDGQEASGLNQLYGSSQ
jgi:hypothetical protein